MCTHQVGGQQLVPGAGRPGTRLGALSPYQRRVLQLMATGMSNTAIATELGVSRRAVENQVSRLLQALGLSRENDAVAARVCAVLIYLSETAYAPVTISA